MPNSPKATLNETNLTLGVADIPQGISGVIVTTEYGPIGRPDIIITSVPMFERIYGRILAASAGLQQVKRALERGSALRIVRAMHYNDVADPATYDAEFGIAANDPFTHFTTVPKYPGARGNALTVKSTAPSNGRVGYFDLIITLGSVVERFTNLKINAGRPDVAAQDWAKDANVRSNLARIVYEDLSAVAAGADLVPPLEVTQTFAGGIDGLALVAADYIGSATGGTGFHAFNGIDDVSQIAILDDVSALAGVHAAGAAYAGDRKDLQYFIHLESVTEAAAVAERQALNIDSSYVQFYAGGVRHVNPINSVEEIIPELGDVLGIAAASEKQYGAWLSFAAFNRGLLINVLGAGNNWGSKGNYANLNLLAQSGINVVIDRSGRTVLWGNFTGALTQSKLSYGNVRRGHIFLRKSLMPILEQYLEEPNEPTTWKKLFLNVQPFLDGLVSKRMLFEWRWEGDQFAEAITEDALTVNDPDDIDMGKYKARLFTKDIVSMQEVAVDITLTPSGVSFEEALGLVQL